MNDEKVFQKSNINWLACIYTVHQGNPYKMRLFRE